MNVSDELFNKRETNHNKLVIRKIKLLNNIKELFYSFKSFFTSLVIVVWDVVMILFLFFMDLVYGAKKNIQEDEKT